MLGQAVGILDILVVLVYLLLVVYLGWLGYTRTRTATDYLIAGRKVHPYVMALFWKKMTRTAAIWSMIAGFAVTSFWLLFVKAAEAGAIGLVQKVTGGKTSIFAGRPNWDVVDPLVVALPISIIVAVVVSLCTKPPSKEHLDNCFK